jgi:hypothetical protein
MRWKEILTEASAPAILSEAVEKADIAGTTVMLYRDPSPSAVWSLINRFNELRGIEHGGTIWLWNSYEAVHFQIMAHFGFRRNDCGEFSIRYFPDGDVPPEQDYGADVWIFSRENAGSGKDMLKQKITTLMQRFAVWAFR